MNCVRDAASHKFRLFNSRHRHCDLPGPPESFSQPQSSRTKNQPKEEVFGTDAPRTSGGHLRGYPGPKLRSGWSKSWKNKHLGADIHDPKARTSTTLRDFRKLRSEKLWAEFSFPKSITQKGVHTHRLTAREREHWFL